MFIKIFRANYFYNFMLFPIIGALLLLGTYINGEPLNGNGLKHIIPIRLSLLSIELPFQVAVVFNFATMMVISFLILHLNSRYAFAIERTFLPVYLFLFIVYAIPDLHVIHPIFIAAIFIILAIRRLFDSFEIKLAISNAFDSGVLIGMAAIFYLPAALLIFLIPVGLIVIRIKVEWREIILPFLGLILPWLLIMAYFLLFKDIDHFYGLFLNMFTENQPDFFNHWSIYVYLIYLALLIIISSIFIIQQYGLMNIGSRRFFKIFSFFFAASCLIFLIPFVSFEIIVIMSIPLTFLLTNYFIFMKRRFWAELFMIVLMVFSFALQYII